jgi:hypothetical protein
MYVRGFLKNENQGERRNCFMKEKKPVSKNLMVPSLVKQGSTYCTVHIMHLYCIATEIV